VHEKVVEKSLKNYDKKERSKNIEREAPNGF
jgi:hypothetical protein